MAYIMATLDDESSDYVTASSTVLATRCCFSIGGGTKGGGHLPL